MLNSPAGSGPASPESVIARRLAALAGESQKVVAGMESDRGAAALARAIYDAYIGQLAIKANEVLSDPSRTGENAAQMFDGRAAEFKKALRAIADRTSPP